MKPEITGSSWDDLVFESRNKEYGAYLIRKSHDDNIAKGFLSALLLAAFVFGAIQVASLLHIDVKEISKPPAFTAITDPPIIIRDPVMKKQELKTEKIVNKDLLERVVIHEVVETPPVTTPETSQLGSENETGTPVGGAGITETTENVASPADLKTTTCYFDRPEVYPQYDGGLKAMARFISKNIHYPVAARTTGQEGIVYVRFVISNTGRIVEVEVIKGVSALLDEEAMRVVALMTKWKPGLQNNLPVNVRMVLPIKFALER
jgi:protein TonB